MSNMDETIGNTPGSEHDMLTLQIQDLKAQVLDYKLKNELLEKELLQLRKENAQLKRVPLFVAAVVDVLENGEVYLRQQGNNQEYVTAVNEKLHRTLKPGMKVAVNNTLSIVKIIGNIYDTRVRVMELDEQPSVTFEQIGGLKEEIEEVREAVEYPLTKPEIYERIGVEPPKGILLYGPPGTGKTLLARAVAHQTNAHFLRVVGSELVQKYIGEGARLVRELFDLAKQKAPSIIFIDEIDAIGAHRNDSTTSGDREVQRTLMQLLAEMDGFDNRGDVKIIAATNRIDILDRALLRPGRFDRMIEIPLPDLEGRLAILKIHTMNMSLGEDVNLAEVARLTEGKNGAELRAICMEAGMFAIRMEHETVSHEDFIKAIEKLSTDFDRHHFHTSFGEMFA